MSNSITDRIVSIAEELDALAGDLQKEEKRGDELYDLAKNILEELSTIYNHDHILIDVFKRRLKQLKKEE